MTSFLNPLLKTHKVQALTKLNMSDLSPSPSVSQADQRTGWKPLCESQLDLLREGRFSDVTFIVGPSKERIPCHHIFLKSRSPVFQVMFSERWNHDKEIPLEDVDPKIFTKFLEFMYADNFDATVPEALGLLQVAHKYDVHLLVDKCEKLLESETTMNDAVDVFQAARKYGKIQLMDKLGDLVSKSPSELQSFPSFSRLDKETLAFIVKRDDLKKIKEVDLFCLALQWARNQPGLTAQECLEDILPHIRFPVMTLEEFTRTVLPTDLLSKTKAIKLFRYFGSDAKAKKSLARTLEFSTQRRQSPDSIVSVPIYCGDYEDENVDLERLDRLRECLQFHTRTNSCQSLRKPSYLECADGKETTVGLNGITLCCPFLEKESYEGPTQVRKFKIQLLAKHCCGGTYNLSEDQNYEELLEIITSVVVEECKMQEIKFETAIPVRHSTLYCIKVEEVPLDDGTSTLDFYPCFFAKELGPFADSVEVNIDNKCQAVLDIHRNKLKGFENVEQVFHGDSNPQLICKLGFEEL